MTLATMRPPARSIPVCAKRMAYLCGLFLAGCGTTEIIVEKPVPVEVVIEKPIPVPADFLIQRNKSTLPAALKYGEALQLWAEDRANLDSVNAQLRAIQGLSDGNTDNP